MEEVLKKMENAELNYTILERMLENANGKSEKFKQLCDLDGLDSVHLHKNPGLSLGK